MSLAETAVLAVELKLGTTGSFRGATSEIAAVERAAAMGTGRVGALSGGFDKAGGAARAFGGALGHAKNQLGSLISGPLGLVGLGAGLFTVAGALEGGIEKATELGKTVSRLSAITGLSVETTSALASALEHFGIGSDQAIKSVAMLEKNVGNLTKTTASASAFEKTFGLALTDANGNVKDANTLILASADYFNNKSIPAQTKAAALAKLYGRSWADLVPFLKAGSQGIKDAEEEAAKLGLTLTKDNIGQLAKLKEATRGWGTALGGLEVQLGLLVVGPLTDLAKFGTTFVANNRDKIVGFFKDLIRTAQQFAGFVTSTVIPTLTAIGSAAKSAWGAIPAPLRDLLVKGFIADKAIKFAFGFSPITFAKDAISGLLGRFLDRGGPGNPMFVVAEGGLGGGIGGGAVGGSASKFGKIASVASKVFLIGAAVGVFAELKGILDEQTGRNREQAAGLTAQTNDFVKVAGIDDMRRSLQGIIGQEQRLRTELSAEGIAYRANIDGVRDAVDHQRNTLTSAISKAQSALVASGERNEAIAAHKADAVRAATWAVRDKIEGNRIAVAAGAARTASAASAAGLVARAGGLAAAAAIKAKNLSTSISIPVTNKVTVNSRSVVSATTTYNAYFGGEHNR